MCIRFVITIIVIDGQTKIIFESVDILKNSHQGESLVVSESGLNGEPTIAMV